MAGGAETGPSAWPDELPDCFGDLEAPKLCSRHDHVFEDT